MARPTIVADTPAFSPEIIEEAAKKIRRSSQARSVFLAIYKGKSYKAKTAEEIAAKTGLTSKRCTEIATYLANNHIVDQSRRHKAEYSKIEHIATNYKKILRLAENPKSLANFQTIRKPSKNNHVTIPKIVVPKNRCRQVSIDDIDSFKKAWKIKIQDVPAKLKPERLSEGKFKTGIQRILGDVSTKKDWGGENNDIYSSYLKMKGRRVPSAFALKGPATTGLLTPKKMGKNGDQVRRLVMQSDARLLIVQYEGEIAESIREDLMHLCYAKAGYLNTNIYYCVIDRIDSYRLRIAYPSFFQ